MTVVGQRSDGRDNNFNLLRMLAASAVLLSHAFPLAAGAAAREPLEAATGYKLGTTAVILFFTVSGFFITRSFDRRASVADFAVARFARIYPGLLVALLLSAFVLGPALTTLSMHAYFGDRHAWTYTPHGLSLHYLQWTLPGLFAGNPAGPAVNGSLWTLFYEAACYALVAAAGLLGLLRRATFPLVLAIAAAPLLLVPQVETGGFLAASIIDLPFALGAAAYVYRAHVPVSWALAALLAGAAVAAHGTPLYDLMHTVALSYGALWFGFARLPLVGAYNRFGDYSYGVYIYAYPAEQLFAALIRPIQPLELALISFPVTLACAVASWRLVERPALEHRHALIRGWRRSPARG